MEEDFESFDASNLDSEHSRVVVHLDVDCFYAQVEMLKNPLLTTKPLGIKQKNYVITSNYIAREFGVKKCMTITEAKKVCPELILVNGEDLTPYKHISSLISGILKTFSPVVERSGIDEAHVDVTKLCLQRLESLNGKTVELVGNCFGEGVVQNCNCGCIDRLKMGSVIAKEMRDKVKNDLGLTCCAGVAHNKLLAKLACRVHKPNQQTTVFPSRSLQLMLTQKELKSIPGIGHKLVETLNSIGVSSIEDLQSCESGLLEKHFPKHTASWLKDSSFGVDNSEVKVSGKPQSISVEDAFIKSVTNMGVVRQKYTNLIKKLLIQVDEDGRIPKTIKVTVRTYNNELKTNNSRESRQQPSDKSWFTSLKNKPDRVDKILETVMKLFSKMVPMENFLLTLVGVGFTNFGDSNKSVLTFFHNQTSSSVESEISECSTSVDTISSDSQSRKRSFPETKDSDPSCSSSISESNVENFLQSNVGVNEPTDSDVIPRCPAVDLSVWCELPLDIRREIVSSCASHEQCNRFNFKLTDTPKIPVSFKNSETPKVPVPFKKSKKDSKSVKQNSIKKYFSK
ncbi:DNA polymerase iota [Nilaparvata lugens]|uniref:DNA polymerase iota n=1 Tax=Nilaparvata lugens TaxID=108931 RepID=UPI00193E9767|nr:DNA polymerase iota [Nilaparvata lugens]